jgi:hypothetical protein
MPAVALERHPSWAVHAWEHWHRPWAVTHPSWLCDDPSMVVGGNTSELVLRLHYPAWCRRRMLESALAGFEDSTWWRLLGLARAPFERVTQRVGLTLMFAASRHRRLLRREAAVDVASARWALERAHFIPESVVVAVGEAESPAAAQRHAALSLSWCVLDEAPALWPRLRMRFPREDVQAEHELPPRHAAAAARAKLTRLWDAATRCEHPDITEVAEGSSP